MQVLDRVTLIVSDDNKTAYLRESTKEDREATGELQVEQVYCIPVRSKETGEIVGYTGNYTNLFSVIHASSMINNNCDAAALREDIIWCEGCTYRLFGDADLELCWREAFPLQIFLLRRVMAEKVKGWIRIRLETFGNRTIIDAIKVLKEVDHHLEGRVQAAASLFNPETCDKILNKPRHQIFEGVPCVLRNIVIPITDLVKKF
ncbi:uncharacterized protein LOC118438456 [Folsomia candida]|nr:uncharacterized protein LOC118438456 [Folsomia candida]